MTDDQSPPDKPAIGPSGQPFVGLVTHHVKTATARGRKSGRERVTTLNYKTYCKVDPLDVAAQQANGTDPDDAQIEALAVEMVDNQVMWCVLGRIDGGPWSHTFAAENIRAATFPSRRRADATMVWFRRQAEIDANGCEYKIVPLMRGEKAI